MTNTREVARTAQSERAYGEHPRTNIRVCCGPKPLPSRGTCSAAFPYSAARQRLALDRLAANPNLQLKRRALLEGGAVRVSNERVRNARLKAIWTDLETISLAAFLSETNFRNFAAAGFLSSEGMLERGGRTDI
jgi:hypothetical protein